MRRVIRVLLVAVALVALAGCGSTVKNVIASVSASHTISLPTDPTTAAPTPVVTTAAPTTAAPTTAAPTTAAPTTPAATTAAPSPAPIGTTSTSTPAWLWLILALVLLAGIAFILIARSSSKRSAVAGDRKSVV